MRCQNLSSFVQKQFQQSEMTLRSSCTLIVIFLLVAHTQAQTTLFHSFDTVNDYIPTYSLGYIQSGYTIQGNLTAEGAEGTASLIDMSTVSFNVQTDTYPSATSVACTQTCASSIQCIYNCPVTASGVYRVNITKANTPADTSGISPNVVQYFQLSIGTYFTTTRRLLQATNNIIQTNQAVRDRVIRLVSVDYTSSLEFTLYPVPALDPTTPDLTQINIHLFKVSSTQGNNNVYVISGAMELLTTTGSMTYYPANQTLKYRVPLSKGLYVVVYSYQISNVNFVRLSFQTFSYSCPYSVLSDKNKNFQGCVAGGSSGGGGINFQNNIPFCIDFNSTTGLCHKCQGTYILVGNTCQVDTSCKDRRYYSFGECKPVHPSCGNYTDAGECIDCNKTGFILDPANPMQCIRDVNIPICNSRQYISANNKCIDVSGLCGAFDNTNGFCLTCSLFGYVVDSNGACVEEATFNPNPTPTPTPDPICLGNQYVSPTSKLCKPVPANCVSFDSSTERCLECIWGMISDFSGVCRPVNCPPGQVMAIDGKNCIPMPPFCAQYDSAIGQCTKCTDTVYVLQNGNCKQVTSSGGGLASCSQRVGLGFGACADAKVNCANYDLQSQNCLSCNVGWSFGHDATCSVEDATVKCRKDQNRIQGLCLQAPDNCLQVDKKNLCKRCIPDYVVFYGGCQYRPICGVNQYRLDSGHCQDKPPNCDLFNSYLQQCITCINGQSPIGSVCCAGANQRVINGVCQVQQASTIDNNAANNGNTATDTNTNTNTFGSATNNNANNFNFGSTPNFNAASAIFNPGSNSGFGSQGGFSGGTGAADGQNADNEAVVVDPCQTRHPSLGYCIQCAGSLQLQPDQETCL